MFGMASEFYGFYPLIVGLGVALGYDAMFGFAIIAVGEFVGFMGATLNPYSVGIAQTISGVELYSGTGYRAICFVIFMAISIIYVMVYGRKIKKNPGASVVFGEKNIHAFDRDELNEYSFTLKDGLVLLDVLVVLVVLMLGLIKWGYMWDSILKVLEEKVKEGVEVRVMYDGMCCLMFLPYHYPRVLEKKGIR